MTKKDYTRAASIVRELRARAKSETALTAVHVAETALVLLFSEAGRPFDVERFRKACEA